MFLSYMINDFMREFRKYDNTKDMLFELQENIGHTLNTKLRVLTIKNPPE